MPASTPAPTTSDQKNTAALDNLPTPPVVPNAQTTDRVHMPNRAGSSDKPEKDSHASQNGSAHNTDTASSTAGSASNGTPNTGLTEAEVTALALTCAVCGLVNRPGELACSRCGNILATGGTTRKLSETSEPQTTTSWPTGEVIVTDQEPIILEIGDKQITVPLAEVITIGRSSDIAGDETPGVDLSPFGAGDQGVSRKHIKIKRKNILVYVADLGSLNGTLLNGRRLIPNAERLLRNGDELQLGRLKIRVKF
ncbi:MAG: FHA domain-containing protein [Chloroflexota bacterium]